MKPEPQSKRQANDALIGSVIGGRYRIDALLGEGGMGAVYRAEQLDVKKTVAVKVLHRDMLLNPEVVARFEREAVAGGRITHPHVARAFDFGRLDSGSFFLALEFVEGKSLGRALGEASPFPERRALRIARQIADALSAAHAAGVVHRDLKPENVMLLNRPLGEEFVKVLDFGIAKLRGSGSGDTQPLTQLGTVFGTPEYMSPEQARGMEVDGRSDLYTLGLILYEMLSGDSPFSHDDVVVILARQLSMQPPPLSERVSSGTRELVRKLLKKEREDRPATAAGVRDALDALLEKNDEAPVVDVDFAASEPPAELGRASQSSDAPTQLALPKTATAAASAAASPVGSRPLDERAPPSTVRKPRTGAHVALFGYALPRRALYAFAGLLVLAFALTFALMFMTGEPARESHDPVLSAQARASALAELVVKAEGGDQAAVATLLEVPPSERTPSIWRTLIFSKCPGEPCFELVKAALAAAPALVDEPLVVRELRRLSAAEPHGALALELAAAQGARGADVLYDVASDRSLAKSPLAARAKSLLEEDRVRQKASPALSALLRLSSALKAPRCGELKRILGEASGAFDQRALPALGRLAERRGCGLLGLGDCYSCLRSGRELKTALEAAKSQASPRFDGAPRAASSAR